MSRTDDPYLLTIRVALPEAEELFEFVSGFALLPLSELVPTDSDAVVPVLRIAGQWVLLLEHHPELAEPAPVFLSPETGPAVMLIDAADHQHPVGQILAPSEVTPSDDALVAQSVECFALPFVEDPDTPRCLVVDRSGAWFSVYEDRSTLPMTVSGTTQHDVWFVPVLSAGLHLVPVFFLGLEHQQVFQLRYEIGREVFIADQAAITSGTPWVERFAQISGN